MTLQAGDAIHFAALLDADGNTLHTVPLDQTVRIPDYERAAGVQIDIRVDLHLTLKGSAK